MPQIKVIGASWCAACGRVKQLLDSLGVPYVYEDCAEGECPSDIPVTQIGDRTIVGYRESELREAVKEAAEPVNEPPPSPQPLPEPPQPLPVNVVEPQAASRVVQVNPWPWMAACMFIGFAVTDYYIGRKQ